MLMSSLDYNLYMSRISELYYYLNILDDNNTFESEEINTIKYEISKITNELNKTNKLKVV